MLFAPLLVAQDQKKAYSNYDFIPGAAILFEDDFRDGVVGEFPPRWNLLSGQAVVNRDNDRSYLEWTEGTPGTIARIQPAVKKSGALFGASFTIEFDYQILDEQELQLILVPDGEDQGQHIGFSYDGELSTRYFPNDILLKGNYPSPAEQYIGKWHHAAFAYKDGQLKGYLDQHRVLVIPKCGFRPVSFMIGGCEKVRLGSVKVAEGGGMNMLGKILTDGKLVTHAITFAVNRTDIRPESFGFLNEMVIWLKENPGVKLEISGHTDADGSDVSNMTLSQARSESVKSYLVSSGIVATRLVAKGYGESKPVDSNETAEGKANNRRVEFVLMK